MEALGFVGKTPHPPQPRRGSFLLGEAEVKQLTDRNAAETRLEGKMFLYGERDRGRLKQGFGGNKAHHTDTSPSPEQEAAKGLSGQHKQDYRLIPRQSGAHPGAAH